MANNEFSQIVSVDFAPHESLCEWCGKPAVQQLTAMGGKYHNEGGFFCLACGEEFTRTVRGSSDDGQGSQRRQKRLQASPEKKYGSTNLPIGRLPSQWSAERDSDNEALAVPRDETRECTFRLSATSRAEKRR
jgi:hypothetical protein